LLAVTSVYSRMASGNEVVAIKSVGIAPTRVIWPALWLALGMSLVSVWLNDVAVSWGRHGAQRVVVSAIEDIVYRALQAQRRYSSPGMSINVQRVEGRRLVRPTLSIQSGGGPDVTVTAEEASLEADLESDELKVVLRNGSFDVEGRVTVEFPDVEEHRIPLNTASRAKVLAGHPSSIPLADIPGEIDAQQRILRTMRTRDTAAAAMDLITGRFEPLAQTASLGPSPDQLERATGRLFRLKTEPHRRWSAGMSCFCFVWVGVPMAVWMRGRDFLTSFFVCFLPILVVYYPLLAYGIDGAKNGSLPPWGVWVGNGLLIAWGWWMLRKVKRY
jgi:lipopolysaccharide export system permease protein